MGVQGRGLRVEGGAIVFRVFRVWGSGAGRGFEVPGFGFGVQGAGSAPGSVSGGQGGPGADRRQRIREEGGQADEDRHHGEDAPVRGAVHLCRRGSASPGRITGFLRGGGSLGSFPGWMETIRSRFSRVPPKMGRAREIRSAEGSCLCKIESWDREIWGSETFHTTAAAAMPRETSIARPILSGSLVSVSCADQSPLRHNR